jgi:phosphate transport system permease protein
VTAAMRAADASGLARRRTAGVAFAAVCFGAAILGVVALALLLFDVTRDGFGVLSWDFLNEYPSRFASRAGVKSAFWGTLWLMGLTGLFCIPIGIGAAIWLEEYAGRGILVRVIQTNISNLAGVPSIVYGILGLAVFVRAMQLDRSIIAGALTMTLLVLPIVIISAQEALRAVPPSIREAALAVGATRWQTIRGQVLPAAVPGMMTGIILALSRAIGETAPLIMIGALTYIAFTPGSLNDPFTVLPIQIFNWVSDARTEFHDLAAGAIIVLLIMLLSMNALAVFLRARYRIKW